MSSGLTARRSARVVEALRGPLAADSGLLLGTTVLMAVAGAAFWVVAARLHDQAVVGLAGSLVAAVVTLSMVAQLGVNVTLVRTLPHSDAPAADLVTGTLVTGGAGLLLGTGYAALLPLVSPALAAVVSGPAEVALFGLLVAAAAVNLTTDSVFLARRRLVANLRINGLLMGAVKLLLPFVLAGWGALGLVGSVGGAAAVAATLSVLVLLRGMPRPDLWRPSSRLRSSVRFAFAGYAASLLDLAPILLLPVVVLNRLGAETGAVYFIGFQLATLLNSVVYAVGGSMFAEGSRRPEAVAEVTRRSGLILLGAVGAGVVGLLVVAPWVLHVFGAAYAEAGVATLRVLAVSALAIAVSYWSVIRLRLAHRLASMWLVPLSSSATMLALAWSVADRGPEWVAASWGLGHLVGAVVASVLVRRR